MKQKFTPPPPEVLVGKHTFSTPGFTLVELVIVIVIVGILSIVAIPIYKNYVEKAKRAEGRALLGAIKTAQDVYYAEHGKWYTCGFTQYDPVLLVDARSNKYYMWYKTNTSSNAGFWAADVFNEKLSTADYAGMYWWNKDPATSPDLRWNGHRLPVFFYVLDGNMTYESY